MDLSPWVFENADSLNEMFYSMMGSAFNQVLCWDVSSKSTYSTFSLSSGSVDSNAAKCACVADEYYNGSVCVACASGTSFGKTESCVTCSDFLCAPTPAPTTTLPPTITLAPTIEKTPINDDTFNEAMNAWFSDEEEAEKLYGHMSGKFF